MEHIKEGDKTCHAKYNWCLRPGGEAIITALGGLDRALNTEFYLEMTVEIILEAWTLRYKGVKNDLPKPLQPAVVFVPMGAGPWNSLF